MKPFLLNSRKQVSKFQLTLLLKLKEKKKKKAKRRRKKKKKLKEVNTNMMVEKMIKKMKQQEVILKLKLQPWL